MRAEPSAMACVACVPGRSVPLRRPLLLVLLVALGGLLLGACNLTDDERTVFLHVNGARFAIDAPVLAPDDTLTERARAHALRLATEGRLFHSTRDELLGALPGARRVGENVARSGSLDRAHEALMASPSHRANILERGWDRVGVGVVRTADGTFWIVQLFADVA